MPKMLKATFSRPSADVEFAHPLTEYSQYDSLPDAIKTSYNSWASGLNYTSTNATHKTQAVVDGNTLSLYLWVSDYPETTPENLANYFWAEAAKAEKTVADESISGNHPVTNAPVTIQQNKYARWRKNYFNDVGITVSNIEEVDYTFPA
jgi:hypothetical protein